MIFPLELLQEEELQRLHLFPLDLQIIEPLGLNKESRECFIAKRGYPPTDVLVDLLSGRLDALYLL